MKCIKQLSFILFNILLISNLTAQSYSNQMGGITFNNDVFEINIWNPKSKTLISKENLLKDEDGFMYYQFDSDKVFFLYGCNLLLTLNPLNENFCLVKYKSIKDIDAFTKSFNHSSFEGYNSSLEYFKIKKISSSSFYTEKLRNGTISYKPDYLNVLIEDDMDLTFYIQHAPWVAGKINNPDGIGEYLDITFLTSVDNVVVLNGYVDFEKKYLYKANNRLKTVVIESLDESHPFTFEYTFEDYVHFSQIDFPAEVMKVRMTIKDVYPGNRWNDTCVTAVITNEI